MAAEYKIHRPFVLAMLPRPLDHTKGNIVTREVYGQKDGSKKRKRTELVVGIDGENTSIYDVCVTKKKAREKGRESVLIPSDPNL